MLEFLLFIAMVMILYLYIDLRKCKEQLFLRDLQTQGKHKIKEEINIIEDTLSDFDDQMTEVTELG
jgi:hypothetical protein